jgi:NADH-quinone oxidoreductase subunit N
VLSLIFTPQSVWIVGLSLMLVTTKRKKEDFELAYIIFLFSGLSAIAFFTYQYHLLEGLLMKSSLRIAEFTGYLFTVFVGLFVVRDNNVHKQEALMLLIIATVGYTFLLRSESLISIFIAIELLAFSLYTLVALSPIELSYEAALKYFIQGSFASIMILFSLCLLYGLYGDQVLFLHPQVVESTPLSLGASVLVIFAKTLFLCSLCFKLGLVPFHFWVTDVYSRCSLSSLMYLGIIPKIAFFTLFYKILHFWFPFSQSIFPKSLFIFITLLTLYWANMSALASKTLGKILGYSSMGQMAYLLLVCLVSSIEQSAYLIGLYHLLVYAISFMILLGVFLLLKKSPHLPQESLIGSMSKNDCLTLLAIVALLSLAGIPPFPGFFSKFFILSSLVKIGDLKVVIAALFPTVIACAVYLKLIAHLLTPSPDHASEGYVENSSDSTALEGLLKALALILLLLTYYADFFVGPYSGSFW